MSSSLRLAPSLGHFLGRSVIILLAAAAISAATLVVEGPPSSARARLERSGPPYGPTLPFGLVQFVGQSALFGAGVLVARKWLKVRL
jgi:hypothetical protein